MAEIDTTTGGGDLIYVGHSQGLTEIHDTNAVSSATVQPWAKYYTTGFETAYMAATTKGMFPFNETTGDLVDASPIANVLEPENPPTYGVNGVHGTGLDFDGSADYLCSDADNNGACDVDADFAVGTTAFHVQLWFKSPTTAAARTLVDKTVTAAGAASSGWRIWMTNTGTITFGIDGDATTFPSDSATSTRDYDDDQWHHLVAVKGNTSTGVFLYIDGQLVGSDTATVVATTLDATTTMLAVGARCNAIAACTTATEFFDGAIDDLQMSMGGGTTTDTLNQSQVRRMYLEGRAAMAKKTTIVDNPTTFSSTTIGDSGESYILNEFVGSIVEITAGTGAGQTRRVVLKLVVVAEPKMRRLPEAETLPAESAKKRPFKLEVEVAIKIPSARRLEVIEPSVTVTAVVNTLVAAPPVASAPQVNLPVVALYKTVWFSALQSVKPVW
jgi:hypothetical protein